MRQSENYLDHARELVQELSPASPDTCGLTQDIGVHEFLHLFLDKNDDDKLLMVSGFLCVILDDCKPLI